MSQKFVNTLAANALSTSELSINGNFVLRGVAVVSPKSGNKVKIGAIGHGVIVAPNGPLNDVTVIFPEKAIDGQIMFISFTQDVKKVTFTNGNFANKSTLGPVVKAGDSITLFYHEATGKWYKLAGGSSSTTGTVKMDGSGSTEDGSDGSSASASPTEGSSATA